MATRTLHIEMTGDPKRMRRAMLRADMPWWARMVDRLRERMGR